MATRMGIRELRDNLTATIRRGRMGETIEVTHHGASVAVLAPVPTDRIERLVAAGEVTRGAPLTRALRRFPVTGRTTASQAIEEVPRAVALANPALAARQEAERPLASCTLEADELVAYERRLLRAAAERGLAVASPGLAA